jgi:ribonuclease HI
MQIMADHYIMMFDGGSRGNPGICGSGFVIYNNDSPIWEGYKKVSEKNTNNYAEYMGAILGMAFAIEKNIEYLHIKGDSLLVINQLLGKWKVNSDNIKPLYAQAKQLMQTFKIVTLGHVKRDKNKAADRLANKAMDE